MGSVPPSTIFASHRRGSIWSHLDASKLTSSFATRSRYRGRCCLRWRATPRLRIPVDVGSARDDDGRNRMFENELLLIAGFENYRVLVKRSDAARQLHSADQIDRNVVPFLSCRVEERILNILLRRLCFHMPISFFAFDAAP